MIIEEIRNIDSSTKEIKKFAYSVGTVLLLISAGLFLFDRTGWAILGIIALLLIVIGIAAPKILKPIHKIWMSLAVILGFFMSRVILTIIFYIVLTPLGLLAKIFGKRFLELKIDKEKNNYWNYRAKTEYNPRNTEKQF